MPRPRLAALLDRVLQQPPLPWVLLGFALAYVSFFIQPVFWAAPVMQFSQSVPVIDPIGTDLRVDLQTSEAWFSRRQNPYVDNHSYA